MRSAATTGSMPAVWRLGLSMNSALARAIKKKVRDAFYVDTDD